MSNIYKYIIAFTILSLSTVNILFAQTKSNTIYKSKTDDSLTVKSITVFPVSDNQGGIYSRPVENFIIKELEKNHAYNYKKTVFTGPIFLPEELYEKQGDVKNICESSNADALVATRISKGPNGISVNLNLFLKSDGKLFARTIIKHSKKFDLERLKPDIQKSLQTLLEKIPYDGLILSRQGNRVTLNLGKDDGLTDGQILSVIQILNLKRHPKFNFLISTQKEVLGKIKILKLDNTLSFGSVISEIEKGVIQKNAKITGLNYVTYRPESLTLLQNSDDALTARADHKISMGKNAREWVPQKPPTFGKVSAAMGLGTYLGNLAQSTSTLESRNSIYPSIDLQSELWLTSKYSVHAKLKQGVISISNPASSGPSKLSMSMSAYDFEFGYNIRLGRSSWSSKIELLAGYASYKLFVDDVTTGLTTLNYNGFKLGASGLFPISRDGKWHAGAHLFIFVSPNLTESPGTSGGKNDNTVNQFGVNVSRKVRENFLLFGNLDIALYTTKFTGAGSRSISATSSSQRHTTFAAGAAYLF